MDELSFDGLRYRFTHPTHWPLRITRTVVLMIRLLLRLSCPNPLTYPAIRHM
jgi:hypothetical protein